MSVWKNSPAEQAGLHEGDTLRAINGQTTDVLTLDGISKRLHAKEGTLMALAIQRDQQRLVLTVRTRELLCRHGR
jgi:C-terminal processing protease CtpA/Prc